MIVMTEKQFHLKIKWKNREKTEAIEIVLYDGGQPLCELISVDDARLVRDVLNEQEDEIKRLKDELQNLQTFKKILESAEKDMEERADWQAYCEKEFEGL